MPDPAPSPTRPAFELRGEAVEARNAKYRERLTRYYEALCAGVKTDAPDLYAKLQGVPPKPLPTGYQLLPKFLPPAPPPVERPRAASKWYSWPWTEQKIDIEMKKLDGVTADLGRIPALPANERRPIYEKLVNDYSKLTDAQRNIEEHVQYNRVWQPEIGRQRAGYDKGTHLHDAVLERQAILDTLDAKDDAAFRTALGSVASVDHTQPRAVLEPALRGREAALAQEIHAVIDEISPPGFVRVEHPTPHVSIVHVPFRTDIDDAEFLRSFREAVESVWHVRDGDDEFRVELSITYISPADLYRRRPGCENGGAAKCVPPKKGDQIDVPAHVALFPPGAAVLTTGSNITYFWNPAIVVGPQDARPHTFAHEFGHVLGFRDEYFRGYSDLGPDGFRVMEVVAEPEDVMGNPGSGPVPRHMFERLITTVYGAPATPTAAGK